MVYNAHVCFLSCTFKTLCLTDACLHSQGQPSGEAFIQMDSEAASFNAAAHKNNKYMFFNGKKRYIEVLQCSGEDMNQILLGLVPSNLIPTNVQRQPMYPSHRGLLWTKGTNVKSTLVQSFSCTYGFHVGSCTADAATQRVSAAAWVVSFLDNVQRFSADRSSSDIIGRRSWESITNCSYEWPSSECNLLSDAILLLSYSTSLALSLLAT